MAESFHILVVDDELAQRAVISGFLEKQGFNVTLAEPVERPWNYFVAILRSGAHRSKDGQHVGLGLMKPSMRSTLKRPSS